MSKSMSMFMLHDQVHAACPCPCCIPKSMLHAPVHAAGTSTCLMLSSMSSRSTNQYLKPLSSSGRLGREVWGSGAENRWGWDSRILDLSVRRPTPLAPINTRVLRLKGGSFTTSSYRHSSALHGEFYKKPGIGSMILRNVGHRRK
jgi:hypothetical protein